MVAASVIAVSGTHGATAGFTSRATSGSNTWTVGKAISQPYTDQVLVDAPYAYYQVDEVSGAVATDSSGNSRPGTLTAISAYRKANGLPRNPGYSIGLGGQGRLITGGSAVSDPSTFSLELWFRTTTKNGGKLIGFEDTRNSTSPLADRHVFMETDGRLTYGAWNQQGPQSTITSPQAYNNGGWHHLVLTASPQGQRQNAVMYVDGREVVAGRTSRVGTYAGWWRVGFGSVPALPGYSSADFSGDVDQVAVYSNELNSARVESHWAAR